MSKQTEEYPPGGIGLQALRVKPNLQGEPGCKGGQDQLDPTGG